MIEVFSDESEQTSDSVSGLVGVSKTTARRYLEYAVSMGFLEASVSHGSVGRPTRIYKKTG
ncbi:hypothetical protein JCM19236_1117 [Vibrio sp. JCM 19236]|nr:hypothetical protein JCM19236_1117 [Vibrio sp. JCM 19236]